MSTHRTSPTQFGGRASSPRRRFGVVATMVMSGLVIGSGIGVTDAVAAPSTQAPISETPSITAPNSNSPGAKSPEAKSPEAQAALVPDHVQVGPPMPVPTGSYGYLATHDLTKRMKAVGLAAAVAGLPVPPQLRNANLAFAQQLDIAINSALSDQRGCLQMIANPSRTPGNIFDYGFYAVSEAYCS